MAKPAGRFAEVKRFLGSYALAFVGGVLAQMVGVLSIGVGQGAVVVILDLMLVPVAVPVAALLFVPVARRMRRLGNTGLARFVGLGFLSVVLPMAVALLLTLRGEPGDAAEKAVGLGLMAINLGVTYGGSAGFLYWRFSGFAMFECPTPDAPEPARRGRELGLAIAALLVWQLVFWRIALILTGGL